MNYEANENVLSSGRVKAAFCTVRQSGLCYIAMQSTQEKYVKNVGYMLVL